MKLNKYIYAKLEERYNAFVEFVIEKYEIELTDVSPIRFLDKENINEELIEDWITDWYNDTFKDIDDEDKPRGPPMWLAGPRWYDRRRRKIAEAKAEADAKVKDEA